MQFVVNAISTATERKFDGRTYLVAPVVMLAVGVLNESLVTAEEVGKSPQGWHDVLVTLGHPQMNGQYVSARADGVNANAVGRIQNPTFVDGKLKAEVWVDVDKATALGGSALTVLNRLRSGQPLEVSTGYFADSEEAMGKFNGKLYSAIARNIRPDHLALLPDSIGACSWQDGCGTPRVNEASAPCGCQKGHGMNEEEAQNEAEAEVVANAYRVADESFISAVVNGLLSALGRGKQTISANAEEDEDMTEVKTETPVVETPVVNKQEGQADAFVGIATLLEKLNQRMDSFEAKLTANADKERNELIATLAANERCPFDETELKALSTAHLTKLATAYQPADYSLGAGVVANRSRADQFETLAMPTWVVAGKDK